MSKSVASAGLAGLCSGIANIMSSEVAEPGVPDVVALDVGRSRFLCCLEEISSRHSRLFEVKRNRHLL
jgi:hypothetical protein